MQVLITGQVADSAAVVENGRIEFSQAQRFPDGEVMVTSSPATAQVINGELRTLAGDPFYLPANPETTAVRIREMLGGQTFEWWAAVPELDSVDYRDLPLVESADVPASIWGPPSWLAEVEQARDETVQAIEEGIEAVDALGGIAGIQALVTSAEDAATASSASATEASGAAATAADEADRAEAAANSIDMTAINARLDDIEEVADQAIASPDAANNQDILMYDSMTGKWTPASFGRGITTESGKIVAESVDLVSALEPPFWVAHRGSARVGLDSSLEAFEQSFNAGFTLELDVWRLADGGLAVWHDRTTGDRVSGTNVDVNTLTTLQWKSRHVLPELELGLSTSAQGTTCTFDDMLDRFGGRTILWPEIKDPDATTLITEAILSRNLTGSVIVQTVDWDIAQGLLANGIKVMYRNPTKTPAECASAGISYVGFPVADIANVPTWKAAGVGTVIFTNSYQSGRDLVAIGCDGVMTDDPWFMSRQPGYGAVARFGGNRIPGMKTATSGSDTPRVDIRGDSLMMYQSTGGNSFNSISLGGLGYGGPVVRVGLTVNSLQPNNNPPTESTLMFGLYLGKREDGFPIVPGGTQPEMYRAAFVRRDGRMQLENKPSYTDAAVVLGNSPADANAPVGLPSGNMDFEVLFANGSLQIRNLTRGLTYNMSHASWAGAPDDMYLTLHTRGATSSITNIWSQTIAS